MALQSSVDFCLLIPHYNNVSGLLASLQSVRYSGPFLALVVDDGSTTPPKQENIAKQLPPSFPLKVVYLTQNGGITAALNAGLQWIKQFCVTRYVARLDCGDVCAADRFTAQLAYMQAHPQVGLLGSWCRFEEGTNGNGYLYKTVTQPKDVWRHMHLRNVLIHPTVLFRTALLQQVPFYPTAYPHAEDYAFFWELMQHSEAAILPQVLVTCRLIATGLSGRHRKEQLRSVRRVIKDYGVNGWLRFQGFLLTWTREITPLSLIFWLKKGQMNKK